MGTTEQGQNPTLPRVLEPRSAAKPLLTGHRLQFGQRDALRFLVMLPLLLAPCIAAVSSQSLWIDEAISCNYADHSRLIPTAPLPSLGAISQMPAFYLLLPLWVRLFGDSERALRAVNLPFAALFFASLLILVRRSAPWKQAMIVPFAIYPLLIFYVNECRPYVALLAFSTAAVAALYEYRESGSGAFAWICCLSVVAAFTFHLFGALLLLLLFLTAALDASLRSRIRQSWRQWIAPISLAAPPWLALLLYYRSNHEAGLPHGSLTNAPGSQPSTWKNLIFFFYEALGLDGLGPPRNDLRSHPTPQLFAAYAVGITLGAAAILLLLALCLRAGKRGPEARFAMNLLSATGATLLLFFCAARAVHLGFLPRHVMTLAAAICGVMLLVLVAERIPTALRSIAFVTLLLAWGVSSCREMFVYRYGKDDARAALEVANRYRVPILWNADLMSAAYYGGCSAPEFPPAYTPLLTAATGHWTCGIRLRSLAEPHAALSQDLSGLEPGEFVLVRGKADTFDPDGLMSAAMLHWRTKLIARLNGYDVWYISVPDCFAQAK
jgi:succinate dehydrogenase/fumarate reductase cytochrome b subunit